MAIEKWLFKHKGCKNIIHIAEPKTTYTTLCGYALDGIYVVDEFCALHKTDEKINCPECIDYIKQIKFIKL